MTLQQLLDQKGRRIFSVRPEQPVLEAIRLMAENHVGALLVMDGPHLAGVVSERDYARKVVLQGRAADSTPVQDIMSAPAVVIRPDRSVEDAMRLMTDRRFRHLPVVLGSEVLGVVSIGDLVKCVIEDQRHLIQDLQQYIQG